jgi:murein DD-endopeptidase MepM/ murein hydrolase activator NlpD
MKRPVFALLILLFCASCRASAGTPTLAPSTPALLHSNTFSPTIIAVPTSTPTLARPTATHTSTTIPCDPLETYCIEPGHFVLDRPITPPGNLRTDAGYPYGSTAYGTREPHHGVEFPNATGVPVLAAADGVVAVAGDDGQSIYAVYRQTYGNLVVLEHRFPGIDGSIFTLYAHLSQVNVQPGQTVQRGQMIGQVGSSGIAIGSHLHFEVRQGRNNYDSNRNPLLWLAPLADETGQAQGVLAGRLEDKQGIPLHADSIHVQYYPDRSDSPVAAWQVETYAPEKHPVQGDDAWRENFSLGELQPGDYRISLMWGGKLYDRWVKIAPAQITFLILRVNP